ncbi:hypothetical protein Tco_1010818 [Tanacetum coccineum]
MNRVWAGSYRQEVADKERWKKAAEEASQQADLAKKRADLAKKQAESANKRAARVELVLDKFMGHYNQQQTQAGGFSFTSPPLPTTFVPETVSGPIPDPYSDPNRYYKVMNPGSSRIPNDDKDGDDQDGNDKEGNGNNEVGIGSDESSSASKADLLVSWMVTDLEDSKTHTVGGVWSGEYMDLGFTKSMLELDRCYTMLQELRSMIVGGALIHKNHEASKHEGQRIHPTIGDFGGNCASNQSPLNNGRIDEW